MRHKTKITAEERRHPENMDIIHQANQYSYWANQNVNKTDTDKKMIDYLARRHISFEFRKPYFIHDSTGRIRQYFLFPYIFRKRIGIMFADSPTMVMRTGLWKVNLRVIKDIMGRKGRKVIVLPCFDEQVLDEIFGEHPNHKTKVKGHYGI